MCGSSAGQSCCANAVEGDVDDTPDVQDSRPGLTTHSRWAAPELPFRPGATSSFASILKQSSIATKSPSPVFCVVFWAGTDGRKKIIWKREKEEDKKETNKLEKYVL